MNPQAKTACAIGCVLALACSSKTDGGPNDCAVTADCQAGSVCVGRECRRLCGNDLACKDPCSDGTTGSICVDGVCQPGCRDAAPVILGIDGNGPVNGDSDPMTSEHRVAGGLKVHGENLDGSLVELVAADATRTTLATAAMSATEIEVCLVEGTPTGTYELVIANDAGAACGDFELVQGVQGPAGTYTAGLGIVISGDELRVDVGSGVGQIASGPELANLTATVTDLTGNVSALQTQVDDLSAELAAWKAASGTRYPRYNMIRNSSFGAAFPAPVHSKGLPVAPEAPAEWLIHDNDEGTVTVVEYEKAENGNRDWTSRSTLEQQLLVALGRDQAIWLSPFNLMRLSWSGMDLSETAWAPGWLMQQMSHLVAGPLTSSVWVYPMVGEVRIGDQVATPNGAWQHLVYRFTGADVHYRHNILYTNSASGEAWVALPVLAPGDVEVRGFLPHPGDL